MRHDWQVRTVRLATGVKLAYVRHGDPSGVPILLVHPWGESLGCFDRLLPLLPATVHALAMDQRGHGDAEKPASGYAVPKAWFPRFHDVPEWYVQDRVDDGVRMPAHVWRKTLAGLIAARPPTETGTITAPTLIIWGRDELLSWEDQQALAAAIDGSRLMVYEDTGHLVLWEQPERVASDLAGFVGSLPS